MWGGDGVTHCTCCMVCPPSCECAIITVTSCLCDVIITFHFNVLGRVSEPRETFNTGEIWGNAVTGQFLVDPPHLTNEKAGESSDK